MSTSKQLKLNVKPKAAVETSLGKENSTFKLEESSLPELKDGEILFQTVYISNDPAQRGWIGADADPKRLYVEPVKEGATMRAGSVGKVVKTKGDVGNLKEGDWINPQYQTGWSDFAVLNAKSVQPLQTPPKGAKHSIYLGALGSTGLTAYFGVEKVLKLQKGESIVVSGAAGAVGNVVVQYAKHVVGAKRVIAIAGSDDKCDWLKTLGADTVLNYKDKDFYKKLGDATEDFPECYFDNVGGEMLDYMLTRVKRFGRIACCGAISGYNGEGYALKNNMQIISNRLTLQGFIVIDFLKDAQEALKALSEGIQSDKIKVDRETVERVKFEEIPATWVKLFSGHNTGKLVTQIADE